MLAMVAAVVLTGFAAVTEYSERQRLLGTLRAHVQAHPEDGDIVQVLVGCNSRIILDTEACSRQLIARVGADQVLNRMSKLQVEGAFGWPLGPDGQPVR